MKHGEAWSRWFRDQSVKGWTCPTTSFGRPCPGRGYRLAHPSGYAQSFGGPKSPAPWWEFSGENRRNQHPTVRTSHNSGLKTALLSCKVRWVDRMEGFFHSKNWEGWQTEWSHSVSYWDNPVEFTFLPGGVSSLLYCLYALLGPRRDLRHQCCGRSQLGERDAVWRGHGLRQQLWLQFVLGGSEGFAKNGTKCVFTGSSWCIPYDRKQRKTKESL